ncbi:bacteriocin immunity protein [Niastella populi]|uniref:Uncharacterized protein n=1 Tax=Niastella populi TaxID=550983 RepID=A0A1V9FCX1_9BACT|nr:bacteriocin immunity protein [Niastella populi]OQP56229.1 hypothetical protein A4R26_26415 [Niastella populi]
MDTPNNKQELIVLVQKIMSAKGTQEEIDEWIEELESKVLHPRVADLIYHENLTAEEVVEKALAYKPFNL